MDVLSFLQQGNVHDNPEYNPKTKKGRVQPPFLVDYNPGSTNEDITMSALASGLSRDVGNLNQYADEDYLDYDTYINDFDTKEELDRERAKNQSWIEQTGRFVTQAVGNEVVLGTALGLSNLVDMGINLFSEKGSDDYTNPVSEHLEGLQEENKKRFAIYQENPNDAWAIGDFGWWANNAVSIASTASMLIPSTGVVKGISWLGNLGRTGKVSRGMQASIGLAKAVKKVGKIDKSTYRLAKSINAGTEIGASALLSRTMENYLEARGVYNEVKEQRLAEIQAMSDEEKAKLVERNPELKDKTDEEMANYIASVSADRTFQNDYAMLLMDIAQFKAIGSLWKGVANKTATAGLRTANKKAIKSLVGESVETNSKLAAKSPWLNERLNRIQESLQHPLTTVGAIEWSEGLEEAYQGIQTEKGKEVAEMIMNPNYTSRTLDSYIRDPHIWEQAFWGVLGGMGFQAVGKGLGNLYKKTKAKLNKDKLTEQQLQSELMTDEKIRLEEIKGRAARNTAFVNRMQLLNNLQDYEAARDNKGNILKDENGVEIHKDLTPEEAEIKKAALVSDYVTAMTTDAIDTGNYDLLKEYISSAEFDKYLKDAGADTSTDNVIQQQLITQMDVIRDRYENNLYEILKNTEVDNEHIAKLAARELTRESLALDDYNEELNEIYKRINESNVNSEDVNAFTEKFISKYVTDVLNKLNEEQNDAYTAYRNGEISKIAYDLYERDFNNRRKSIINLLNNTTAQFSTEFKETISNLANSMGVNNTTANDLMVSLNKFIEDFKLDKIATSTTNGDTVPKSVKDLIRKEITLLDSINYLEYITPKTNQDYIDRTNEISEQNDIRVIAKMNKAAKDIEDYIIKQDDLNKAKKDVLENKVKELEEANAILKLGYYTTKAYYDSIDATIKEERKKREKQAIAENNPTVNGTAISPEVSQTVTNNVNNIEENASPIEESNQPINHPSTGKETGTTTSNTTNVINPNEVILIEEDELDKANEQLKRDAQQVNKQFDLSLEQEGVSEASKYVYELYRDSRNLIDNALGKEENSEEVNKLIEIVKNKLISNGTSVEIAEIVAIRGIRAALDNISSRLLFKKNPNASSIKELANTIALRIDTKNAATTTLEIEGLNPFINDLIEKYIALKNINVIEGQPTTISLERLFHDIINDEDIKLDPKMALYVMLNMKDYINTTSDKYNFKDKAIFREALKNPIDFISRVSNPNLIKTKLDNYMHISAVSRKDAKYESTIEGLIAGTEVEVSYGKDRNGEETQNAISFSVGGQEIGFISSVRKDSDNNGFTPFISKYAGGIAFHIRKEGNRLTSNSNELFNEIFKEGSSLWKLINKQVKGRNLTDEEIKEFINNETIKNAIGSGLIVMPVTYDPLTKQWKDKYVTDRQKVQFIINKLEGIIFYNQFAQSMEEYKDSYNQWIENAFTNYQNTVKIQDALDNAKNNKKKIKIKFAGFSSTYNKFDDVRAIISDKENNIGDIGLTFDKNPIVGVVNVEGDTKLVNEATGTTISSNAPFTVGSMGMLIGGRESTPILALFTSSNKLGKDMKQRLRNEIIDIVKGFQNGTYNYEEVSSKLANLFNGPGIKTPTIFQGYSVVDSGRSIALSINGNVNEYVLVINKFKKDSNETGTGITYIPDGKRENAKSSISVNDSFIEKIAEEIASHVTYNRTFYTLENLDKDDTSNNQYMFKRNGKFVIKLGGTETEYTNFGEFALKENAFKTNQGVNEKGGFFENTDKINSLYIDVETIEEVDSTTSPLEGTRLIEETITSASTEESGSTKELLETATMAKDEIDFLSGDNPFNISLVPERFYYDKKATRQFAYYRNGKVYFTNLGAKEVAKSPATLRRILIHETLHGKFDEHSLFEREGLVEDLLDVYNKTIEAIENVIKTKAKNDPLYRDAVSVKNWIEQNKFNPIDYFTKFDAKTNQKYADMSESEKDRIFAEEWLVETLTQPLIASFMNNNDYYDASGRLGNIEGIKEENKSLWQKIIDLLLKLFGVNRGNIKNNSIFARQYLILSTNSNIQSNTSVQEETKEVIQEKPTKESTTAEEDVQSFLNKQEDATTNITENQKDIQEKARGSRRRLAATTTAEEYIFDQVDNDGDATAETFGVTRITNMDNYLNMYPVQDQPIIAKMLENGELKWVCR